MPPTIVVALNDEALKKLREDAAQRVVDTYDEELPEAKLLCFFDNQDWWKFKRGKATRGLYSPVHDEIFEASPESVRKQLLITEPSGLLVNAFDHFIYIHNSACDDRRGLTLTFAHELQHFRQFINTPHLWAASSLIPELKKETLKELGWKDWVDVPHEREARIIGKQTALAIIDANAVQEYIATRFRQAVDEVDHRDWEFLYGIRATDSYDLKAGVRAAYQCLKPYRSELEDLLLEKKDDPTFPDVDLEDLFSDV
jgi:hypothetical protein